jgi:hypothetical protein
MNNFQNLDMNYYKQIAERVNREKAQEKAEALKRKDVTPEEVKVEQAKEENQEPKTFESGEQKKDYVYVPSLGLYISENRYHDNQTWNKTQEILHKEGRRMPTIPEFIAFLKYLRSPEGKTTIKNSEKILDEVYTVREPWRSEWLDANFGADSRGPIVTYHSFDKNGNIAKNTEALENYLDQDKTPGIDLDSWLNNHTKQGLPKYSCKSGKLYYWSPVSEYVARFYADSDRAGLVCGRNPDSRGAGLGVRYVEARSGETASKISKEFKNELEDKNMERTFGSKAWASMRKVLNGK